VVADVIAGYALLCDELAIQLEAARIRPSHVFVQAGVGGLAAALATGLAAMPFPAPALIVVEPKQAACVGPALATGAIRRLAGDLDTVAEMLSCGEASAPAVARLRDYGARHCAVGEAALADAAVSLERLAGIASTASGAAGWAGLERMAAGRIPATADGLNENSVVLLIVTEARLAG
jgi:diaminopropionate ammonia-lyase